MNPLRELIVVREILCCERAAISSPREYCELIVAQICASSRKTVLGVFFSRLDWLSFGVGGRNRCHSYPWFARELLATTI